MKLFDDYDVDVIISPADGGLYNFSAACGKNLRVRICFMPTNENFFRLPDGDSPDFDAQIQWQTIRAHHCSPSTSRSDSYKDYGSLGGFLRTTPTAQGFPKRNFVTPVVRRLDSREAEHCW